MNLVSVAAIPKNNTNLSSQTCPCYQARAHSILGTAKNLEKKLSENGINSVILSKSFEIMDINSDYFKFLAALCGDYFGTQKSVDAEFQYLNENFLPKFEKLLENRYTKELVSSFFLSLDGIYLESSEIFEKYFEEKFNVTNFESKFLFDPFLVPLGNLVEKTFENDLANNLYTFLISLDYFNESRLNELFDIIYGQMSKFSQCYNGLDQGIAHEEFERIFEVPLALRRGRNRRNATIGSEPESNATYVPADGLDPLDQAIFKILTFLQTTYLPNQTIQNFKILLKKSNFKNFWKISNFLENSQFLYNFREIFGPGLIEILLEIIENIKSKIFRDDFVKVLGPIFGPVVDYLRGQGQVEKQASEPGQCQCKPTYGSLNKDYTKSSTALLYYQQKNSSTTGEKFMLSLPLIAGLVAVLWCVYDHRKATNQNYLMPG